MTAKKRKRYKLYDKVRRKHWRLYGWDMDDIKQNAINLVFIIHNKLASVSDFEIVRPFEKGQWLRHHCQKTGVDYIGYVMQSDPFKTIICANARNIRAPEQCDKTVKGNTKNFFPC